MASEPDLVNHGPVVDTAPRGRPLLGQHIDEIRETAAANGWAEGPPLTFIPERAGWWPVRFEVDGAGMVIGVAWARGNSNAQADGQP